MGKTHQQEYCEPDSTSEVEDLATSTSSPGMSQPWGNAATAQDLLGQGSGADQRLAGLTEGLFGDERQVAGQTVGGDTGGLGGLWGSFTRLIDRAQASSELRDRFDVVPDDFVGPRLPNQVTESEYDEIVNTYSDIRTGNSNFRFDSSGLTGDDAAAFRDRTMQDFASILQTPSGRGLVNQMAYGKNADGSAHTLTLRGITNPAGAGVLADNIPNASNGTGSNGTLSIAPGQPIVDASAPDHYGHIRSDMVLYHELVHANHNRNGTRDATPMTAAEAVDPKDIGTRGSEYQAMGLGRYAGDLYTENRYRAERRAMGEDQRHWDRYNP